MTTPKVKIELEVDQLEFLIAIFGNASSSEWVDFINNITIHKTTYAVKFADNESYEMLESLTKQYKHIIDNNLVDVKQSWIDDVVSGDTELSYKEYSKLYTLPKNLFEDIRFVDSK